MDEKLPNNDRLHDKVALVTGGASGIGEGICLEFASHGAAIAIVDINGEKAERVLRKIEGIGGKAILLEVDVRDHKKIKQSVKKALEHFGTIDILVNCAGVNQFKLAPEFAVEEWERIRSINLDGAWCLCQEVLPALLMQFVNVAEPSAQSTTIQN